MFELLREDPARFFDIALYRVPAVLIALIFHEYAHGFVAYRLGDDTAKRMGRLTLNPIAHLDLYGTILMLFAGFGWAKPVPIDPRNFTNERRDDLLVSMAGITMNLIMFIIFMSVCVVVDSRLWVDGVYAQSTLATRLGFDRAVFINIVYGYGDTLSDLFVNPALIPLYRISGMLALVNLSIAVFNLIPIPPLDGSHVLNDLILKRDLFAGRKIASLGGVSLLVLSFTGILSKILSVATEFVQGGFLYVAAFFAR